MCVLTFVVQYSWKNLNYLKVVENRLDENKNGDFGLIKEVSNKKILGTGKSIKKYCLYFVLYIKFIVI